MIEWIKSLFRKGPDPRTCVHEWKSMGEHENHPAFEYKGKITFLRCFKCESRYIQQG